MGEEIDEVQEIINVCGGRIFLVHLGLYSKKNQ